MGFTKGGKERSRGRKEGGEIFLFWVGEWRGGGLLRRGGPGQSGARGGGGGNILCPRRMRRFPVGKGWQTDFSFIKGGLQYFCSREKGLGTPKLGGERGRALRVLH